jgi:hypothetical protein
MAELIVGVTGPDCWPPSIKKLGRILVEICGPCATPSYKWEYEVIDCDSDSSVFWINEGVGFEYWLDQHVDFGGPGVYVVQGISGSWIRGDGWTTEDDEEWEFTSLRPALRVEVESRTLVDQDDA